MRHDRAVAKTAGKDGRASAESEFHGEARALLAELRDRARAALAPAIGDAAPGATEWARALSIDTKLAWKLVHLLDPGGDLEALQYVPGRQAFEQILVACENGGGTRESTDAARLTFERYETLVRTHAGNRKAFDVLVTSQHPRGTSRAEVNLRRSSVEANASLLGVRARAQVAVYGFAPSRDGETMDLLGVRKIEGMERMRPNVNWRIARSFKTADDGTPLPGGPTPLVQEAIDESLVGLPVVSEFSTSPLPPLGRVETDPSTVEFELRGGEVGASARFDLTTAEIFRPADSLYADADGSNRTRVFAGVRVPCDLLYVDLVVHPDLFVDARPEVEVVSTLHTGMALEFREPDKLLIEPEFESLGRGLRRIEDRERHRHAELVRWSLHQAGWDPSEFEVFRLKLPYPPLPSAVAFDWERKRR